MQQIIKCYSQCLKAFFYSKHNNTHHIHVERPGINIVKYIKQGIMNYFRHFVAMPLAKQVHTQKTFQCFMLGQDTGITPIIEIIKPS